MDNQAFPLQEKHFLPDPLRMYMYGPCPYLMKWVEELAWLEKLPAVAAAAVACWSPYKLKPETKEIQETRQVVTFCYPF